MHGCALFRQGEMLTFVEDVGRHNAIDTIAGWMWLHDLGGADKIFYTTGRLTSEMVIKSAQMGVPIVVSRSGVTQMGLELAERLGLALFGRATNRHFICYCGFDRFDAEPEPPRRVSRGWRSRRARSTRPARSARRTAARRPLAGADVALRVAENDQAVGLAHAAQDARALRAGDPDLPAAVGARASTMPRWYSVRPGALADRRRRSRRAASSSGVGVAPLIASSASRTSA